MHWSVGDKIGMYVTADRATYSRPQDIYVNNFAMTGLHSEPTRATTFKGLLTQSQISQLDPTKTYRHFSYYPYGSMELYGTASYNTSGIIMEQTIPSSFSVRPNEFPTDAVYMFAEEEGMNSPMTWLENGEQKWSEKRTLTYKHTMAYLRVKINSYSRNRPLSMIRFQVRHFRAGSGPVTTMKLAGKVMFYSNYNGYGISYNTTGTGSYDYIDVVIDGTINVGDYIYIPIPWCGGSQFLYENGSDYDRFRFTFYEKSGNSNSAFATKDPQIVPVSLTAMRLEAGKIYDIAFNL